MKRLTLTLLVVTLLLSGACGTALVEGPPPELDDVEEALGYSLTPAYLPEGFEFDKFQPLESPEFTASVDYRRFSNNAYHHIFIRYPQSFSPSDEDNLLPELLGPDWQRPGDTMSEVKVNGETAYLVRGAWSDDTMWELASSGPKILETVTPNWDYDVYLSLYFDFELSQDETIGVMIQAMLYPSEWITAKEMVKIAESLKRSG